MEIANLICSLATLVFIEQPQSQIAFKGRTFDIPFKIKLLASAKTQIQSISNVCNSKNFDSTVREKLSLWMKTRMLARRANQLITTYQNLIEITFPSFATSKWIFLQECHQLTSNLPAPWKVFIAADIHTHIMQQIRDLLKKNFQFRAARVLQWLSSQTKVNGVKPQENF